MVTAYRSDYRQDIPSAGTATLFPGSASPYPTAPLFTGTTLAEIARLLRVGSPASSSYRVDLRRQFMALAEEWHNATDYLSSPSQIAMHRAYQRIIGMGTAAVPFILADLAHRGGDWYWALHAITGASPIPPGVRHTSREVRDIWLQWGKEHGYID